MNQDRLLNAHKAGRAYAATKHATEKGARTIAAGLNKEESAFYFAGFFGEQKRLAVAARPTTPTNDLFTKTYAPIRPLRAPDNGAAYCSPVILTQLLRVDYGHSEWPSRSYWIVPTAAPDSTVY